MIFAHFFICNLRDFIAIGKIRKPFGVAGFTYVEPLTSSIERFYDLEECFIGLNDKSLQPLEIECVEPKGAKLTLKFKGCDDRTGVEKFTNFFIYVDSENSIKLPDGKLFLHELIGLSVKDGNGLDLGRITNVLEMPAHNVLVINHFGKEVLVPDVKEFVVSVDLKSKTLILNVIEGLFE